jgi:hypothetical protein
VARMVELDRADWLRMAASGQPRSLDELTAVLVEFVRTATGPARGRSLARYALCVEAAFRPELRRELARGNAEIVGWGVPWLRAVGSADPERHSRLLSDYLDGLILHQVAFPDPAFDPAAGVRLLLGGLLGQH